MDKKNDLLSEQTYKIDWIRTGQNLKMQMAEKGVTTKELQKVLGLSTPNVIYEYFKGDKTPKLSTFFSICKHLDINMERIIAFDEMNHTILNTCTDRALNEAQNMECVIEVNENEKLEDRVKVKWGYFWRDGRDMSFRSFWEDEYDEMEEKEIISSIMQQNRLFILMFLQGCLNDVKTTAEEKEILQKLITEVENLDLQFVRSELKRV